MKTAVTWLKRDLRLHDHAPLQQACETGLPLLLLYLFEPSLMAHGTWDERHERFIWESLMDIHTRLAEKGHRIVVLQMEADEAFELISAHTEIAAVYSHEEIGNGLTFTRDKRMKKWFQARGIPWIESPTNGVIRALKDRDGWNQRWMKTMTQPLFHVPLERALPISETLYQSLNPLPWPEKTKHLFQPGGESAGFKYFESFLNERHRTYASHISKPTESRTACSRLSPYLAWGNLSIKQVFQLTTVVSHHGGNKRHLEFFLSRIHWHCHFIQKFESEERIEFENLNSGFNNIRNERNEEWIEAWKTGTTGIPLIDACMRCLKETGYINFRMRSLLVSFLTHHLWQPWQSGTHHLARYFLDYEPGIHYPQFQMQAGTMGVNTLRIYNPTKQAKDHDPEGLFIKKWVPELAHYPKEFIHEPWLMTGIDHTFYGTKKDAYPSPIVDIEERAAFARLHLWNTKRSDAVKSEVPAILKKHTHRKSDQELPF